MKTEVSTYEQQAIDFLAKHGITFEAKFLRHGSMRWDKEGETRDIYSLVLRRDRHNLSVEFGQSIANSGEWLVDDKLPKFRKVFNDKAQAIQYSSRIHGGMLGRVKKNPNKKAPTAYCMLTSITKNDPGTLEEFCDEFGYNTDSIRDNETYKAVKEEWFTVRDFFSKDELEELQEIN